MATQRVILELVAQSRMGALTGAQRQLGALRAEVERLSNGVFTLTKTGQLYDNQQKQFASTAQANAVITAAAEKEKVALALAERRVAQALGITTEQLRAQNTAMGNAAAAANGLNHATGSASFAVISMGQGIQDAGQFGMGMAQGIRAVTNNVQQAAQAFVLLRTTAGSTTKALVAMKAALVGPIGILLAISTVTAGIEFFSNRSQRAKKDTDDLAKSTKTLTERIQDLINVQDGSILASLTEQQLVAARLVAMGRVEEALKARRDADQRYQDARASNVASEIRRTERLYEEAVASYETAKAVEDGLVSAYKALAEQRELEAALIAAGIPLEERESDLLDLRRRRVDALRVSLSAMSSEMETLIDALKLMGDNLRPLESFGPGAALGSIAAGRKLSFLPGRDDDANRLASGIRIDSLPFNSVAMEAEDAALAATEALDAVNQSFSESAVGWLNNNAETITQTTQLMGQAIGSIGTNLMTLAKTGEETDMKLFAAGKAFAIGRAVINTAEGATKALAQGGVMGPVMAATVIAAGAAQIATIASARPGSRGIARSAGGSSSIPSAPNFVSGISNIGEIPSVGGAGIFGFPGQVTVGGTIHASGRELVTVISNEVAAQRRSGVRDPLGLGA